MVRCANALLPLDLGAGVPGHAHVPSQCHGHKRLIRAPTDEGTAQSQPFLTHPMFCLALGCVLGWELLGMEEPFLVLDQDPRPQGWQRECHPMQPPHGNSVSLHQIPVKGEKKTNTNGLWMLCLCSPSAL